MMVKGFFTKVFGRGQQRKGLGRLGRRRRGLRAEPLEDRRLLAPLITIDDAYQLEGNSGQTDFFFVVRLIGDGPDRTENVVVNYSTQDGTATVADNDYVAKSGTLTLPPGVSSGDIVVKVVGDTKAENDEDFFLNFTVTGADPQGQTFATGIIMTDPGENAPIVQIDNVTQTEGNSGTKAFIFTVTLSETTGHPVVVNWTTANGSATAGSDFQAASGQLTIPANQISGTITVQVLGDTVVEPDEIFFVEVTPVSGAEPLGTTGIGTIQNDDIDVSLPTVSISNKSQSEGNSGQTPFEFTVSLSSPATRDVTINYATASGTATAGQDFIAATGSVLIPQGQSSATIVVAVLGDTTGEADETFFVDITSADGANVPANTRGTGTILNDDADVTPPSVSVAQAPGQLDPTSSSPIIFRVTFSEPIQVATFTASDMTVGGTTGGSVSSIQQVGTGGTTFDVYVTGMTQSGTVVLNLATGAVLDLAGNPSLAPTYVDNTVTFNRSDVTPPSLTIDRAPGQADPAKQTPVVFRVVFSEAIQPATFTTSDLIVGGTAGATTASIVPVAGTGDTTFDVTVSTIPGTGTVTLNIVTGAALDLAGNASLAPTVIDNSIVFDNVAPSVTVNRGPSQSDPTSASPVVFRVTFSEAVTGFALSDLTIGGTAGATTAAINQVSASIYDVSITGMTQTGTVVLTVATGAATDAAGNPSTAPTNIDNSIQYNAPAPVRLFTTGVFTANNLGFHLAGENLPGASQNSFAYNANLPTWLPLAGDWDGDGDDTVGVFDPSTCTFYLVNNNSSTNPAPIANFPFSFNARLNGWIPISGDWDGDGKDSVGVWDPFTCTFYLINNNSSTNPQPVPVFSFNANLSGWKPVAGDWDGDGKDTVGVFDPASGTFYLINNNSATNPQLITPFSIGVTPANAWPIAGDWNGDGKDTVGVYGRSANYFYLINENKASPAGGITQFLCSVPVSNAVPIAGDWNGPSAPLTAAALPAAPGATPTLTEAQLQAIADEAIRRWSAAGLSAGQIDRLHSVRVLIADLPGLELGRAEGDAIMLDADAAGHGWFVDPTPGDDAEFGPAADPGAAGRMDLLSAVSHELGHILGLEDVAQGTVMGSTLGTGVRRTPTDAVLTEDLDWRLI